MADDGGQLRSLLETSGNIPGTDYELLDLSGENAVTRQILEVFVASILGVITSMFTGLAELPAAAADGFQLVLDSVMAIYTGTPTPRNDNPFQPEVPGVFDLYDRVAAAAGSAWDIQLDVFGLFALPVSYVILLAVLFILVVSFRIAFDILGGEG